MNQFSKTQNVSTSHTPNAPRWNPRTITLDLIPESQAIALLKLVRGVAVAELVKLVPDVNSEDLSKAVDELAFALMRDLRDQGGF